MLGKCAVIEYDAGKHAIANQGGLMTYCLFALGISVSTNE